MLFKFEYDGKKFLADAMELCGDVAWWSVDDVGDFVQWQLIVVEEVDEREVVGREVVERLMEQVGCRVVGRLQGL